MKVLVLCIEICDISTKNKLKNNNKSSISNGRKPTPHQHIINPNIATENRQELQVSTKARHNKLQHHPI